MKDKKNKGAALLTAVLIAAVVAILASTILSSQRQWIAQTGLADRQNNFQLLAYRLQDWAMTAMQLRQKQLDPSQLPKWPSFSKTMDGAVVTASLIDGNRLYNINWLIYPSMDASFARLLKIVAPTLDPKRAFTLAESVTLLLQKQAGIKVGSKQAIAAPQKRNTVPVIGPFHAASQLATIPGFSSDMLTKLAPLLVALPPSVGINMRTANKIVLQALLHPAPNRDTLWMAYLSCRLAFQTQNPNQTIWQACLQQNDGGDFIKNINSQKGGDGMGGGALLMYRSNIALFNARITQSDLSSHIEATYWMAKPSKQEAQVLAQNQVWKGPPLTALLSYWRS